MDPQVYRAATSGNLGFFRNNWQNLDNHLKQKSPRGDTILHIAARFGHDQIVQRILRTDPELSFSENSISNLPLHEAASGGHQSTADKILDSALQGHQILEKQLLRRKNNEGNTALHLALRNRHKNLATSLFEKDTEVTHYRNCEDKTPLYMVAEAGYSELFGLMAETLLPIPNNDVHRQEIEKYMCRLVRVAIYRKNNDILRKALEKWPSYFEQVVDKGMRPLSYASFIGYLRGVELILARFPKSSYLAEDWGFFPIHMASMKGHIKIIQKILACCPDARELCNNQNQNILHLAAKCGKAKAVSYILKNSELHMLINEKDCNGNTPLHMAVESSHPKVVNLLVWHPKVQLGIQNNQGMTALGVAEKCHELDHEKIPSFRERLTWVALRHAGAPRAPPYTERSTTVEVLKYYSKVSGTSREEIMDRDFYKDRIGALTLVATLILTITYAARLASPGNKVVGTNLLQNVALGFFQITNTLAMCGSTAALLALIWAQLGDRHLSLTSLKYPLVSLGMSLAMLSVSFNAGVYITMSDIHWLAICGLVIGVAFVGTLVVLFISLFVGNYLGRWIFHYPFSVLLFLAQKDEDENFIRNEQ